ncbi:MAG TPA: HXXEE domain-containing protein [Cyclobacteriaceae bacterium]|jgi:hypothetical protein
MKTFSPNQTAMLLPLSLLAHQLEEYFGKFPIWYSNLLDAQLSDQDFIMINVIGLLLISGFSLSYFFNKNNLILVALGTLIFVNGIIHLVLSIFTLSYSPGVISGVILFLPLGTSIYLRILPKLEEKEKVAAISIGILLLLSVSMIAMNI